jgi:hypothetical protein
LSRNAEPAYRRTPSSGAPSLQTLRHGGRWRTLVNVLGNQAVWFVAVIAAGQGHAWPGVLAATLFVLSQVWLAPRRAHEVRLVGLAILCGLAVDGVASAQGWVVYRAASFGELVAPPWILALWASLAVTLNSAMRALQSRLWLGALLGGAGGPLAYLAAARGWEAAQFAAPQWHGVTWLAVAWGIALPALLWAARTWERRAAAAAPVESRATAS